MNTASEDLMSANKVPCCPELTREPCCDRLTFTYRLINRVGDIPVEIKITAELERCPGPLSLGDLVHSTTLLPGETVRLFSSSRKNRFTFDSESQVSYRHEQTSEESYYMSAMSRFMSDLSVREDVNQNQSSNGSFKTDGSVSGALETLFSGPSASASGSYNGSSTLDFMRELTSHAQSSSDVSVQATRAASSVSVGEVQSRSHAEGESESSFESATRTISNPNRCHAVTYFAYQIDKRQTIRYRVVAVTRRVVDPAGDSKVATLPPRFNGDVSVIPQGVLAASAKRVSLESVARGSGVADRAGLVQTGDGAAAQPIQGQIFAAQAIAPQRFAAAASPLAEAQRRRALEVVDRDLAAAGIIDKPGGGLSPQLAAELSFEVTTCLPTPALMIKGCLDDCNVCEPSRQDLIKLEIERKALENKLLERQIALLEKSQEYRCCPAGEEEEPADA